MWFLFWITSWFSQFLFSAVPFTSRLTGCAPYHHLILLVQTIGNESQIANYLMGPNATFTGLLPFTNSTNNPSYSLPISYHVEVVFLEFQCSQRHDGVFKIQYNVTTSLDKGEGVAIARIVWIRPFVSVPLSLRRSDCYTAYGLVPLPAISHICVNVTNATANPISGLVLSQDSWLMPSPLMSKNPNLVHLLACRGGVSNWPPFQIASRYPIYDFEIVHYRI